MKKLIPILLITLLLGGCITQPAKFKGKILKIEILRDKCKYSVERDQTYLENIWALPSFIDSCDKFHVGDTLILTKLNK